MVLFQWQYFFKSNVSYAAIFRNAPDWPVVMTQRNCTDLRSIGNENFGYLKLSELQGMERSRSKDRGSLGIELGTTCTEGRVLTNCATLVLQWRHVITIARLISVFAFCVLYHSHVGMAVYKCIIFLTFQLGQQNGHSAWFLQGKTGTEYRADYVFQDPWWVYTMHLSFIPAHRLKPPLSC